MISEFCC